MQIQSPINRLLKTTCLVLFTIMLPGYLYGQDSAPNANDDTETMLEDGSGIPIYVLANDENPDENGITIISYTDVSNGTLVINGDGSSFNYTPNPDFNGSDSFTYTIQDGDATDPDTDIATVTITITPVNDEPSFTKGADQSVSEDAGAQSISGWATNINKGPVDESDQTLTFAVTDDNEALFSNRPVISAIGDLTYTPEDNAFGSAIVSVVLSDSGGTENDGDDTYETQTFNITVTPVDDNPLAQNDAITVDEDSNNNDLYVLNDNGNGADDFGGDGPSTGTISITSAPENGTATVNNNGSSDDPTDDFIVYTPNANYNGTDYIQYEICDADTDCSTAMVTITVNPQNDEPVFTSSPTTLVEEDASYSYIITATDIDTDDTPTFLLSVDPEASWLSLIDTNPTDGEAVLSGTPTNDDVGEYEVTITATPSTTPITQTFTLTVNDIFGELSISQSSNGNENGTDGSFRINISRQLTDATNITVTTSNNSAVIGDDFTIGSIQLPANTNFIDVPVEIINDDLIETDETVTITLNSSDNVNALIGTPDNTTITITDNDGELTITNASTVNGEEGGVNGSFTINTSKEFPVPTTITVTTSSHSAVIGDDFTINTITLDANTSNVVVPLTIVDDDLAEGSEEVTVTLNGVSGNVNAHIAASNNSTTISIADNDIPDMTINGGPFTIDEGTSGHTFDVGLAAQPLTNVKVDITCSNPDVAFIPSTVTFTNTDWADKQISFSASQDGDLISENDDINVVVDNDNSDNAFNGLSKIIELTVRDDDAAGLVTNGGPFTVEEGSAGHTFTVELAAQPASNVVVDIRSDNSDLSFLPTTVTFTNTDWDEQIISFSVSEDADLIDEMNPIIAEVNNPSSDNAFNNQSSIINITVTDNDQAELSITGTTNAEEDATSGEFTINASQATLGDTDITLNISGSATMGTDYETVNSTIIMPDGSNSISIPINLLNDNLVEGLENIIIEMASVNNTKTSISGTAGSASIDIIDNDIADLVISQTTFSVNEGTNDHSFDIALSAQPQTDVVVNLTSNNTDISLSANTLTFTNSNYGNQTVTFNCLEDDDLTEESANITIAVDNPNSNSLFYDLSSQITVDITDNDTQPVFTSNPITVTNEDAVYTYNIIVSDDDNDIPVITLVTPADPNSTWLTLTDNNNGTAVLTGTPRQADVTGSGSPIDVTIRAEDDLTSAEQTFTITVNNVNDSPQISNSSFSTPENQPLTITLSSFASDEDNNIDPSTIDVTSRPDNGSVDTRTPGEITYTPETGFSGEDSFNVQIQDLNNAYSNVGTITITVSNEAPTANDDDYTTDEDEAIVMSVLDNDTDPQDNLSNSSLIVVDAPLKGTTEINTINGTITYTPNPNENGDDRFTYRICDVGDYCDQATVNITITPINDAPSINNDSYTFNEDTNTELTILDNDSDIDGEINAETITIITDVTNGTLTVNATSITYSPNQDFNGTDSFVYSVDDNEGASAQANVSLTIEPVNDAPIAVDDEGTTTDVSSIVINVVENDIDVDDNLDLATLSITRQPVHGSVTINGTTGNITYEPVLNYYGKDSYRYQICDTDGECSTATVRLTVTTGNAKPNANPDYKAVDEDQTTNFNPLENDNDPNYNLDFESLTIVEGPRFGTYQHTTGSTRVDYTPNANYFGPDTIVYKIYDQGNPALSDQDTVFITVNPINDDPVAADYHLDVIENSPAIVNLAELGSDIENEALSIAIHPDSPAIPGSINIQNQTTLEYTADVGTLCNTYEIKYLLIDPQGGQDEATVFINVIPLDSDDDNIPDAIENPDNSNRDTDYDGTPDYLDEDSDNDGILDRIEGGIGETCGTPPVDTDGDGTANYLDEDSDNDLIPDKEEGIEDCDIDGKANYIDSFDDCADRALNIPEVFVPGSSNNDLNKFKIKGAEDLNGDELFIFNRWGGQVYYNADYDNSWRGLSSSKLLGSEELSEGTYFYVYKTKEGQVIKGTIYIKR